MTTSNAMLAPMAEQSYKWAGVEPMLRGLCAPALGADERVVSVRLSVETGPDALGNFRVGVAYHKYRPGRGGFRVARRGHVDEVIALPGAVLADLGLRLPGGPTR